MLEMERIMVKKMDRKRDEGGRERGKRRSNGEIL